MIIKYISNYTLRRMHNIHTLIVKITLFDDLHSFSWRASSYSVVHHKILKSLCGRDITMQPGLFEDFLYEESMVLFAT